MKRYILYVIALVVLFFVPGAHAQEFTLTKIGALNVDGKYFNHWWYEPTRLTLEGMGSKGANVDVTMDGQTTTIKTSVEDGSWKYTHPTELEKTDHNVTVGSGEKQISFILTIGAGSVPQDSSSSADRLPETGNLLPIIGLLGIAGLLIYYGFAKNKA